jgi:hypothetical protein
MLLCGATFRVDATDCRDIWWNPAESGWGVNSAQSEKFIFATFFVYGAGGGPTWYSGQMTRDDSGRFAGPLYATTGPWFGTVPFDSDQTTVTGLGDAAFRPTAADAGVLTYNVSDVTVVIDAVS